jgi:hypothetical protein
MPELVLEPEVTEVQTGGELLGLEGRHRWDDKITLNDKSAWPRYNCQRITGLYSLGDAENLSDAPVGRSGEIPRRSFRRGKTISYEGNVEARSARELRGAIRDLKAAFADLATEKQMSITPHASYSAGSTYFFARAMDCSVVEELVVGPSHRTRGHMRPFAVSVRASDQRYYDGVTQAVETAPPVAGGGSAPPFIPPFILAPADEVSGFASLHNVGTIPAEPKVTFYGPVTDPMLENTTLGIRLALTGIAIGENDSVVLDFRSRRILYNGFIDVSGKLNEGISDWWDSDVGLPPGVQSIRFSGLSASAVSRARIEWNAAYV